MSKFFKFIVVWGMILSTMGVTYVFAASNTDLASSAGAGVSPTGGYVVSQVEYHFAGDSTKLAAVELELDQPATTVKIKLISADSRYHPCINTGGNHWLCETGSVDILDVDELNVIASSN